MEQHRESAKKLLERNRVGVLLRMFARDKASIDPQITSLFHAIDRLLEINDAGIRVFARIDVLVSSDQNYADSDCGESAERIRERVATHYPGKNIYVSEIKKGDIYAMLLNYGVANQMEDRISFSFTISHALSSYITKEHIYAMLHAMYQKARVAGLVIDELAALTEKGRVANTFALWHNKSLVTVGAFDLRAARPERHMEHVHRVKGWSEVKAKRHGDGDVEFVRAGCEEIIPLLRMVKFFGPSIAIVKPGKAGVWREPDAVHEHESYHRHLAKLATKEIRQQHMAKLLDEDLSLLEEGVALRIS